MGLRLVLVANRASGGGADPATVAALLRERDAEVVVVDVADAARAGDERAWGGGRQDGDAADARETDASSGGGAGPARPDRVVVAGGDGSIGPAARAAAGAGVPLAVVPAGTANDFARALDLPTDVRAAAALAADPAARTRAVELAAVDGRAFVNAASAGLSVLAARRATPLKPRLGALAYAVGALRAAAAGRPEHVEVRVDGAAWFSGAAWQVVVAATGAFGGGSAIAPADPHDALLDVVVLEACPRLALARRARALRFGDVTAQPGVRHARGAAIEVAGARRWNVDGEVCALPDPAPFGVAGTVEAVVP